MDIMQLCRLCLVKDQVNIPIFGEQGDIRQIFLKITACLPVKVSKEDNLPKKICDGCLYKLELLYQFWNTTVNAEKQLLEWLNQAGLDANKKATDGAMAVVNDVQDAADLVLKEEAIDITEVRGDEEDDLSTEANSYILQQQQLPYQTFEYQQDGTKPSDDSIAAAAEETTQPPAKRQKVSAAPAQTIVNPETESDDDIDTTEMKLTKVEDDSDGENPEPTTFVGVDNEQPGPSGVGKTAEAPLLIPVRIMGISSLPKCIPCNKYFTTRRLLEEHQSKCLKLKAEKKAPKQQKPQVQARKPAQCPLCHVEVRFISHLKRHIQSAHSDVSRPFACEICGRKFSADRLLKRHKGVHLPDELKYACKECDKKFATKWSCRMHVNSFHRGVTYECDVCNKKFTQMSSLKPHKLKHQTEGVNPVKKPQKEGILVCWICGKTLKTKRILDNHMNSHLKINPCVCEICRKGFTNSKKLKRHMVVHTKEKPYKCTECDKCFTQNAPLSIHIRRVHRKETPHECPVCHKKFVLQALLNTHMKFHQGPKSKK